ncbi:hypothetical protein BVC80_551g48 [Macleaya cordata]|uniref:Uncharacterized protein n=1 Tax=Macleaya cordata TaxID=56857 RepID=A0A200QE79_MACCD|nr:hypothetical protein BVC80_551g48 [Macleaya cordata]
MNFLDKCSSIQMRKWSGQWRWDLPVMSISVFGNEVGSACLAIELGIRKSERIQVQCFGDSPRWKVCKSSLENWQLGFGPDNLPCSVNNQHGLPVLNYVEQSEASMVLYEELRLQLGLAQLEPNRLAGLGLVCYLDWAEILKANTSSDLAWVLALGNLKNLSNLHKPKYLNQGDLTQDCLS